MRGFLERAARHDLPVEVGVPVYYTLPPSEELRMGRVAKVIDGRAVVIRDGRRESVEVEWCTVAKRAYKESRL